MNSAVKKGSFMRGMVLASAAAACLLFSAGRAFGEQYLDGRVVVTAESPPSCNSTGTKHGYAEYRIRITNDDVVAHQFKFRMPVDRGSYGELSKIERSVSVGAKSRAVVSLLQPPVYMDGSSVAVEIDGDTQKDSLSIGRINHLDYYGSYYYSSSSSTMSFLCCREVSQDIRDTLQGGSGSSSYTNSVSRSEVSAADWPEQWLAYSRFDALVLTAKSMQQLKAACLDAIVRYVECGGCLIVLGDGWTPPATFVDAGKGRYSAGFGECLISNSERVFPLEWRESVLKTGQALNSTMTSNNSRFNSDIPADINAGTSHLWLFMLVLTVAIVMGPMNLIVLTRAKRRMWFLWTVPIISVLTCGVIVVVAAISEGWTGWRSNAVLTILDQRNHHATSIGAVGFYSPMTPGGGLHFDYDSEVCPAAADDSYGYYGRRGGEKAISWDGDQHLESGWIKAKEEKFFTIRKSQVRRERLDFTPGGDPQVMNGLGAKIRSLIFADENGKIYRAQNIAPGQAATVSVTSERVGDAGASPRKWFQNFSGISSKLKLNDLLKPASLSPGTYIAVLEGQSPFVEDGLKDSQLRNSLAVVYGILAPVSVPPPMPKAESAPAKPRSESPSNPPPTSRPTSWPTVVGFSPSPDSIDMSGVCAARAGGR